MENEQPKKEWRCWDFFATPEVSAGAYGELCLTFKCTFMKKAFSAFYNPKEGMNWNDVNMILSAALSLCAQCNQCEEVYRNKGSK